MSVPLERLYNFLHDVCNRDDIIIYRFFPHGSRKIADLQEIESLSDRYLPHSTRPPKFVFFHDQEPLNHALYASPDLLDQVLNASQNNWFTTQVLTEDLKEQFKQTFEQVAPKLNLRAAAMKHGLWLRPVILVHSEINSAELDKYKANNFIDVYWWSHALIARDWFRYAEHDPVLETKHKDAKDFLIYNRAWSGTREYRLKFVELLLENNLSDSCMTWFNPVCDTHYKSHIFKNPEFQITSTLDQVFTETTANSSASADYCGEDYQKTQIEVVLETLFDDARVQLTEKILRPIACGQPFMLAGPRGSLRYLKSYGFETFSPWINESYDLIENPAQRLEAIVQEMKRIANLGKDEKTAMYAGLKDIATKNRERFFSSKWQDLVINEFKLNFNEAVQQLEQKLKWPISQS